MERTRRRGPWGLGLGLALILTTAGASGVAAAILDVTLCTDTVPGGVDGELRRAISEAVSGDTIRLPACTITLQGDADDDDNLSGDLDVVGQSVFLRGAGRGRTILQGSGADRVLDIDGGGLVSIAGVTIRGGRQTFGAGIQVRGGSILELEDGELLDNEGGVGGGLFNNQGWVTIRRSTVAGNRASGSGGGIASGSGITSIVDSTVTDNQGSFGGGVWLLGGQLRVEQSTISGNRATNGAGGIFGDGSMTVLWSTITGNTVTGPSALAGSLVVFGGLAEVDSSILALNTPADCTVSAGTLASRGHNLQGDGTCPLGAPTDQTSPAPGLGPLADNGGPTRTHALLPGSPALDAGGDLGCPKVDQRGLPRPNGTGAGLCDAGAVERRVPTDARGAGPAKLTDPR